ncbi:hypothetical protein F4810DRAFT_708512 [Camillea tinctor]|nr:hypothetical protein F4810DRAFT_708512 [Camillea tinctor]
MFGTIRYNNSTKDYEHIELSKADGVEARGYTSLACSACRSRKLKCSGEHNGCDRCKASSIDCVYSKTPLNARRRHRVSSITSTTSSSPDSSPVNTPRRRKSRRQSTKPQSPAGAKQECAPRSSITASHMISVDRLEEGENSRDLSRQISNVDSPMSSMVEPMGLEADMDMLGEISNFGPDFTNWTLSPSQLGSTSTIWDTECSEPWMDIFTDTSPRSSTDSFDRSCSTTYNDNSVKGLTNCQCFDNMTQLIKVVGVQEPNKDVDMLLQFLGEAIKTSEDVLDCHSCQFCISNNMLLAVIVQHLGAVADTITAQLLHVDGQQMGTVPKLRNSIRDCFTALGRSKNTNDSHKRQNKVNSGTYRDAKRG